MANYIRTAEHARDPLRAERMTAALSRVRSDADGTDGLDFSTMAGWQNLVLGIALTYVLARDSIVLGEVGPIQRVARRPDDADAVAGFPPARGDTDRHLT